MLLSNQESFCCQIWGLLTSKRNDLTPSILGVTMLIIEIASIDSRAVRERRNVIIFYANSRVGGSQC